MLKQLVKLEQNPKFGDPLGNKAGINLEGHFKLYADKKRIRIIYEEIDHIIKIIAIDKREDMEVYLPKPLEWQSFYRHDLPILMDICE